MAQWLGQFTGRSHATRVRDTEETLRNAAAIFRECPEDERPRRLKALRKMAERVLRARLQLLKAKYATTQRIATGDVLEARSAEMANNVQAQDAAIAGGVSVILAEFEIDRTAR